MIAFFFVTLQAISLIINYSLNMHKQQSALITKDGVSYLIPFILVTFCFALWGFANDITNPMVKAFSASTLIRQVY